MCPIRRRQSVIPVEFTEPVWAEEVERLKPRSPARQRAERARREIEGGTAQGDWLNCSATGGDGTSLPRCRKIYVPLRDGGGASGSPFGFVFELVISESGPALRFIAFGERHPSNPNTRSVYERAHRRLHGHWP